MNRAKIMRKAEAGEGLTVAEIKVYQKAVKPERHVYGKYGTLAKQYLEDKGIDWTIANLPEYLHGVDKAADELYETMYEKFSKEERFKRSADFMEKKETTPRRAARRSYEERNKDKRKQTSGNFGTMIPRDLFDEINAFLKKRNMTKVDFIRTAYEIMKSENNGTHN